MASNLAHFNYIQSKLNETRGQENENSIEEDAGKERGSFGVAIDQDDSIAAGSYVLWFCLLAIGLAFAVWVRTLIIRRIRQHAQEQEDIAMAIQRRRRRDERGLVANRELFVQQTLQSFVWISTSENEEATSMEEEKGLEVPPPTEAAPAVSKSECSICLSHFVDGDQVSQSNNRQCPHVFHTDCVTEWLVKHVECPMCRHEFLIPPIFLTMQSSGEKDSVRTTASTNANSEHNGETPEPSHMENLPSPPSGSHNTAYNEDRTALDPVSSTRTAPLPPSDANHNDTTNETTAAAAAAAANEP